MSWKFGENLKKNEFDQKAHKFYAYCCWCLDGGADDCNPCHRCWGDISHQTHTISSMYLAWQWTTYYDLKPLWLICREKPYRSTDNSMEQVRGKPTDPCSWPRAAFTTPFRMYSCGVVGSRSLIKLYASFTSSEVQE